MRFLKIISKKKFILINIFLFLYVLLNLLDGERGLISYLEKKNIIIELSNSKKIISAKLFSIEKKNSLLSDSIDLDYLETIYREKFMYGKANESIYKLN